MTRSIHLAAAVAVSSTLALVGCGSDEGQGGGSGGPPGGGSSAVPAVEVVETRRGALPLRERLTGSVQASGQTAIYPETTGRITRVLVDDGASVQAGQPLVRLEARTPRSQLEQARAGLGVARAQGRSAAANVAELESQFRRTLLLAEDSLVSQETVETQSAQLESARATLEEAESQVRSAEATVQEREEALERTVVRAPIDGVVGQRSAEVGMIADGQTPLFTIGGLERMRVQIPIAQDLIGRVTPGQRTEIRGAALSDDPIEAEVSRVSPFLAEGSFSAEAEIDVAEPGGRLVPGMFVTVDVFYGESDSTTVVPLSALHDDVGTGETGLWTATLPDSGIAAAEGDTEDPMALASDGRGVLTVPIPTRFVAVDVVARGPQVAAVEGVAPGAWVVVAGQDLLSRQTSSTPSARLRASSWDRIIALQERLGPELLREVMEEQQRMSAGAPPPDEPPGVAASAPDSAAGGP